MAVVDNAIGATLNASGLDLKTHKILNVTDPTNPQEGATKNYHDTRQRTFAVWQALSANANAGVRFIVVGGGNGPSATEQPSVIPAPFAGTFTAMFVTHGSVLSTDSVTYTLRNNTADTAATVTIAANGTAGNATGLAISFAAGDKIAIKSVQSSTQANANLNACIVLAYQSAA